VQLNESDISHCVCCTCLPVPAGDREEALTECNSMNLTLVTVCAAPVCPCLQVSVRRLSLSATQ
jgi:hypothetical protein